MNSAETRTTEKVNSAKGVVTRFYEKSLPAVGDFVWVKVMNVDDTSASVQLLEYANHEGMIPYTEFTRLRIRSVGKVMKVGRVEAAEVLRVDVGKGYIDLSKKQVTRDEHKKCEGRYVRARDVHSIVCHAADKCKIPRSEAVEMVSWALYRNEAPFPGESVDEAARARAAPFSCRAHDAFRAALHNPEGVLGPLNLPPQFYAEIVEAIRHRLKEQPVKLRLDVEVTCFSSEGIEAIKEVLRVGQRYGESMHPPIALTVGIVAPPLYILRTQTVHKEEGLQRLRQAADAMRVLMEAKGGSVTVVVDAKVVGDEDKKSSSSSSSSDSDSDSQSDDEK